MIITMDPGLISFGADYLIIFIVIIALAYFIRQPKKIRGSILTFSLLTLSLTFLVAKSVGYFYFDPRPFVVGHFRPIIPHIPDNGFPSDHMLLSSAVAAILYYYNRKISVVIWFLAFIVGSSRVYAGVHHWIDIGGSALVSLVVAFMINQYLKPGENHMADKG